MRISMTTNLAGVEAVMKVQASDLLLRHFEGHRRKVIRIKLYLAVQLIPLPRLRKHQRDRPYAATGALCRPPVQSAACIIIII